MNRRPQGLALWPALLFLLSSGGCSRPAGWQTNGQTAQGGQPQAPFHRGQESAASNPSVDPPPAPEPGGNSEASLPFHDPETLPAGTLLTVRLKNPISADNPGAAGTFDAVLDEAVTVAGNPLIPRGATVAGRVESARVSKVKQNRGYVRLTLDSIDIAGRELAVQTSSLFAPGNAREVQSVQGDAVGSVINLESGRRLTFRLIEPVFLAAQHTLPSR